MVADSPTLVARLRDLHDQREEALARHLVQEAPGDPVAARAVAAQLAAADRLLFRELQARMLAGEVDEDGIAAALGAMARRVFDLLEPAIGAYAIR
ncbi:hypothetical protein ACFQ0B_40250 [Nonomuraea thailandensis]